MKDAIDNPYVAVRQLKTHMFLLIVTRTAHEKMGYLSRSKSMGGLLFILIYRDLPVARAGDSRFPATPTQRHVPAAASRPGLCHRSGTSRALFPSLLPSRSRRCYFLAFKVCWELKMVVRNFTKAIYLGDLMKIRHIVFHHCVSTYCSVAGINFLLILEH